MRCFHVSCRASFRCNFTQLDGRLHPMLQGMYKETNHSSSHAHRISSIARESSHMQITHRKANHYTAKSPQLTITGQLLVLILTNSLIILLQQGLLSFLCKSVYCNSLCLCYSVKCRATRLCSESESGLRNILQDPLLVYAQWSHKVSQVLEASAEVTDFSHTAMLVQNIEVRQAGCLQKPLDSFAHSYFYKC